MPRTLVLLLAFFGTLPAAVHDFDVVVYGGTARGAIAAVSAAREGMRTALLEPAAHIGGMVSGGLSWTDTGKKEVIGGYALEFYRRVGTYYQLGRYGHQIGWIAEPHVAEQIFRNMIREAGVALFEHGRLKEKSGVRMAGAEVAEIFTEDGDSFTAKVFIDSSYEGDLMAQAGVSWTWGRESSAQYGESLAGVREKTPYHQFLVNVSPLDPSGQLLPEVSAAKLPPAGSADKAVQAYNYRMCFSEVPANQAPFEKPAGYDPQRYELLARLIRPAGKPKARRPLSALSSASTAYPTARRISTTTARSRPTTSAQAGDTPRRATSSARASGGSTRITWPACSTSWRATRGFPRRCARR